LTQSDQATRLARSSGRGITRSGWRGGHPPRLWWSGPNSPPVMRRGLATRFGDAIVAVIVRLASMVGRGAATTRSASRYRRSSGW